MLISGIKHGFLGFRAKVEPKFLTGAQFLRLKVVTSRAVLLYLVQYLLRLVYEMRVDNVMHTK